jgi:ribosome-binding factor A
MGSRRLQQVARSLQREVSQAVLTELKDPRIGFVTITRVEPAADLRTARVYFSVLGDEKTEALTLHGLRHATGRIQGLVRERLRMRYFPVLEFRVDESVKATFRLSRLLEESKGERAGVDEGPATGGEAPEDG